MKMKMLTGNERGFTLIELVVAILIFALGFLGITKMQQYAIMGNSFSLQMSNALNIIDSQQERLRGLEISDPDMTMKVDHNGGISTHQGIDYALSWRVNTTGLGPTVNAREIAIRVSWKEKALDHTMTMNMYRSN